MVQMKVMTQVLDGRRVGRFAELVTLDNDATIQEALDFGYVVGKKESVKATVAGVLKAMIDGVRKDGNGRKIDGYVSINAFPKGRLPDVTDEYTKDVANVVARARMLKDFAVDTSNWSIVIEGSTGTIEIGVITTGEKVGEIVLGEAINVNGRDLQLSEGDTISWETPEDGHHGSVDMSNVTSDATRITLGVGSITGMIPGPDLDGRTLVLRFNIGGKKAVKSATMRYVG